MAHCGHFPCDDVEIDWLTAQIAAGHYVDSRIGQRKVPLYSR